MPITEEKTIQNWYALRIFKNRLGEFKTKIESDGYQTFRAMTIVDRIENGQITYKKVPLIPSLLFVKTTYEYINRLRLDNFGLIFVYCSRPDNKPQPIDDAQMEQFMFVTTPLGNVKITYLPDGDVQYKKGDPVRVVAGLYKGTTGVVRRIKKDRKLLVAIEGLAVVAISNIPLEYLQKIDSK